MKPSPNPHHRRAGLSIPNTLEIRAGHRFVMMFNKDMHLRPYVDQRNAEAAMRAP